MNVDFLPTVSVVFLLEYTVMLLLTTSVKVRSTRTHMCEISSIILKLCARFWQISSKIFVIRPQISSIFSALKEWQPCSLCTLPTISSVDPYSFSSIFGNWYLHAWHDPTTADGFESPNPPSLQQHSPYHDEHQSTRLQLVSLHPSSLWGGGRGGWKKLSINGRVRHNGG